MTLSDYLEQRRGNGADLARELGVAQVLVTMWAKGLRPVPEGRAPAIEYFTSFQCSVEELCPDSRWVRVRHPGWLRGKPLLDKSPDAAR